MLQSDLYVFKVSGDEDLLTNGATEKLSDAITLEDAGINDGAHKLFFVVSAKDAGDAAAGLSFTVSLKHCATVNGTYETALTKDFLFSALKDGASVLKMLIPGGLKKYVKASIKANPSVRAPEMLITTTEDTAAKVAAKVRALAASFLPDWVVTGATDAVIFTADANGVRGGAYAMKPGHTGTAPLAIAQTQAGTAGAKEIRTLTFTAGCTENDTIRIVLNGVEYGGPVPMTGGATFNAAIVTG